MADPSQLINSQVNLGIPGSVPDNFQNNEVRAAVRMFINVAQNLQRAIEQYVGITQKDVSLWQTLQPSDTLLAHQTNRLYVVTDEDLVFGNFIYLYDDAGTLKVKKADSSVLTKPARGFCNVVGGTLTGDVTEIIVGQGILPLSGIAPGQEVYLSTTPGVGSATPDTAAGHLEQFLGFGVATDVAYISITQGQYIAH